MWLSNPSMESLTRPRIAVLVVSAVVAASVGYQAYRARNDASQTAAVPLPGSGLHRSNAVRRSRRSAGDGTGSTASSEAAGDENAENHDPHPAQLAVDGGTTVEANADDWFQDQSAFPTSQRAGHNIVNLLFRVSEDNARRNGCVHRGCQCNSCGMVPIRGVRYRCANCADFDLCETCEAQGVHLKTHIFYKIRVPAPPFGPRQMQPVWYTGDPETCRRNLSRGLIARLSRETGFERPELEAFWEQWTFMANTEWRDDPDDLCLAMDRKTFERCLVPTGGSRHASPNLIHDRMFAFYDSNKDDLIGFSEFLHGLSYRKRKDKLRKVFDGYDIDGDKYVNRRDFLRMFRAYYVLYKQMHRDILDGLEDQLLASTETQQLVASRQPLSSLFGREGRVPGGENNLRFEGKTYRSDGAVQVAAGYEHAVVSDLQDTAPRSDILTSLFGYSEHRCRRHVPTDPDSDLNWRTVRRLSGNVDIDRTYWLNLLDPPVALDYLPGTLIDSNNNDLDNANNHDHDDDAHNHNAHHETDTEDEEEEDDDGDDEDEDGDDDEDGDEDGDEDDEAGDEERDQDHQAGEAQNGRANGQRRDSEFDTFDSSRVMTESQIRESYISHIRSRAPKQEKRRRDMARKQLHERWKRRQFYLDEEEGGQAPDDWQEEEDVLAQSGSTAESSKTAHERPLMRSRSSSKVKFAQDTDDLETRSNASTSSRGLPERWGGIDIPGPERDAGKEILYQVTQQAFNELLDTIFKPAEDLATDAAETKVLRERYKAAIEALDAEEGEEEEMEKQMEKPHGASRDRGLDELLAETGYTVVPQEAEQGNQPGSGVEIGAVDPESEYRDPTLPQFRPNSDKALPPSSTAGSPSSGKTQARKDPEERMAGADTNTMKPTMEMLQRWKVLNAAEAEAAKRGGWGRLSFEEFEEIYKKQEHQGNRLDYLGSWIDFCIP